MSDQVKSPWAGLDGDDRAAAERAHNKERALRIIAEFEGKTMVLKLLAMIGAKPDNKDAFQADFEAMTRCFEDGFRKLKAIVNGG